MAGFSTTVAALAAHYARYTWFALTWAIPLVVLCTAGMLLANADRPRAVWGRLDVAVHRPRPAWLAAALAALVAFVIVYSYLIPYHEDLVGLDLSSVTAGRFVAVPIWPETGRFFPLALQEYNVLALVGRSAAVYHGFSIVELIVVLICCVRLLEDVPGWMRCLTIMFMMVLPSFVVAFFGIVYPERDMIVWLSLWIVCLLAYSRGAGTWALCGALISAQCLVYYKEPAFILVLGFAGARLAIEGLAHGDQFRNREYARFAADHLLELAHVVICAVFVAVYTIVVARHVRSTYAVAAQVPNAMANSLAAYVGSDWLVDAFAVVVLGRLAYSVARRRALDPLWDALAIGALAYALAFVKLGLTREYYLAPVDFVGTLYLARLAYAGLFARPSRVAVPAALALAWVFQRNVRDAAHRIVARKEYVQGNVRLAAFLRSYAASHDHRALHLFFPNVGGFELMELSSFLQLKGFDAGIDDTARASGPSFIVKTAHRYPNDRCLASEGFRCLYARSAQPGDLVVYLSGRELPRRTLDSLNAAGGEVFHYRPTSSGVERTLRLLARRDELEEASPDVRVFECVPQVAREAGRPARARGDF